VVGEGFALLLSRQHLEGKRAAAGSPRGWDTVLPRGSVGEGAWEGLMDTRAGDMHRRCKCDPKQESLESLFSVRC